MYCRASRVCLVVFDVTDRESLNGAKEWIKLYNESCNVEDFLLVLIGNKIDLEKHREVSENEANIFANAMCAIYWETSAKTGFHVKELFVDICTNLEERGNKNLKLVANPAVLAKARTLTVLTEAGELIEPKMLDQRTTRCCS